MKTIGIIRLHRWITAGTFVYDHLAQFVDGLFFYYNNLCCNELLHMAEAHPKCVDTRLDPHNWSDYEHIDAGHLSQQRCMQWADEIKPKTVIILDEDQVLPDKFDLDKFEDSDKPVARFKWIWCWGDVNTVIAKVPCPCVWFTQVYKWRPKASMCVPSAGNSLPYYIGKGYYDCLYPGRNLGVMHDDIRNWRSEKRPPNNRGWWLKSGFELMDYNPDMRLEDYGYKLPMPDIRKS